MKAGTSQVPAFVLLEMNMVEIIKRDPPFEGIARDQDSLGIVWCSDGASAFAAEDSGDWIDNLEDSFEKRTPFHFYIDSDGFIYEGLGWGAYSDWHQVLRKNQDYPHTGWNSICVLYLGRGEDFTPEAANAAYELTQEHRNRYSRTFRPLLHSQLHSDSHSGGTRATEGLSLWNWVNGGCGPVETGDDSPAPVIPMMTVDQIKERLDELEVDYPAKARKDALLDLLEAAEEAAVEADPTFASSEA